MVQSMFAPEGEINQDTLVTNWWISWINYQIWFQWKEVDQNELMSSKLTCVYAMPEENNFKEQKYPERDQVMDQSDVFNLTSTNHIYYLIPGETGVQNSKGKVGLDAQNF